MDRVKLRFEHVGVSVRDLDVSRAWYEKVFDARFDREEYMEPLNCRIVHMYAEGGVHFELFRYLGEDRKDTPRDRYSSVLDLRTGGTKHTCFCLELPSFYREKLLPNAVEIDHGPERMGNNWLMFIRDPDGVLYELWDVDGAVRDPHAFDGVPCVL